MEALYPLQGLQREDALQPLELWRKDDGVTLHFFGQNVGLHRKTALPFLARSSSGSTTTPPWVITLTTASSSGLTSSTWQPTARFCLRLPIALMHGTAGSRCALVESFFSSFFSFVFGCLCQLCVLIQQNYAAVECFAWLKSLDLLLGAGATQIPWCSKVPSWWRVCSCTPTSGQACNGMLCCAFIQRAGGCAHAQQRGHCHEYPRGPKDHC